MFKISTGIPTPNCLTENSEKVQNKIPKHKQNDPKIAKNTPK